MNGLVTKLQTSPSELLIDLYMVIVGRLKYDAVPFRSGVNYVYFKSFLKNIFKK